MSWFQVEQAAKLVRLHRIAAEQAKRDSYEGKKMHHQREARVIERKLREYGNDCE